ncbi:MAG: hypothetical protein CM15mP102_03010 [Flavobacteriales bacterium]|nr:MAG: hypothetical protein CM15mP102_03010 [Flavobacteriales bacterium]
MIAGVKAWSHAASSGAYSIESPESLESMPLYLESNLPIVYPSSLSRSFQKRMVKSLDYYQLYLRN